MAGAKRDQLTLKLKKYEPAVQAATPPEVLYHYTSGAGLLGIITSHELWASDVFYLNDPSEIFYSLGLFKSASRRITRTRRLLVLSTHS